MNVSSFKYHYKFCTNFMEIGYGTPILSIQQEKSILTHYYEANKFVLNYFIVYII